QPAGAECRACPHAQGACYRGVGAGVLGRDRQPQAVHPLPAQEDREGPLPPGVHPHLARGRVSLREQIAGTTLAPLARRTKHISLAKAAQRAISGVAGGTARNLAHHPHEETRPCQPKTCLSWSASPCPGARRSPPTSAGRKRGRLSCCCTAAA